MDTAELLRRAWEAVQASEVPESLQEAAFREAVEDLRATEGESPGSSSARDTGTASGPGRSKAKAKAKSKSRSTAAVEENATPSVDEDTFFANLAHESGVEEADLRDVLSLSGGKIHVTPPTRTLGTTKAEQARTVTALVAAARAVGLGERPIDAAAVRAEVKRKNCYDEPNYASKHLGEMAGFNRGGSSSEMVTTSRWPREFAEAVNRALGRPADES
jgi:hypothetical protein